MTPPEEASNEMLLYRLTALKEHVDRIEADQRRFMERVDEGWKSFSDRVDKRFAEMTAVMQNLAYVPRGEYVIEHRALEERVASMNAAAVAKADAADRHAWWAIAMIATTVMGAIITATLAKAF